MKVTAKVIAKEAGVSEATVSLILNGRPARISEKTRARVQEIAAKYNFSCNRIAVSLATSRTQTIGLILPNLTNPLFPRLTAGVEKLAQENDYALFLCNCEESSELFLNYLDVMQRRCIDGLIILLPSEIDEKYEEYFEKVHKALVQCNVPVILVEREMKGIPFDCVCLDNRLGGKMATEFIIDCGHTRIGHITGTPYFKARTDGYRDAMKKHGLTVEETYIVPGDFTVESGYTGAKELIRHHVTAIFAGNDSMALGAFRAITETGLRIPEDIALVGFDDDPIAQVLPVPLTTVRQTGESMGRKACELLLEKLSNGDSDRNKEKTAGEKYFVEPALIVRKTVAGKDRVS